MNSKHRILLIVLLFSFFLSSTATQIKDTIPVERRITQLEESVGEVRRDQLNYQIERDLLKETFSSNYQTVNIVLAIILGIFSVIGFLGIRDIGSIKKEYADELKKLNDLRVDFKAKINQYQTEQNKVKEDYFNILRTNEEQNRRIKVLELQEKAASLISINNYQRALEYIVTALEMDAENVTLLSQKAMCLWKLGDLASAISTYSKILTIDENNLRAASNLIELYLLTNRFGDFQALYQKYKTLVIAKDDGVAQCTYFEVLEHYQYRNTANMRTMIENYVDTFPPNKERRTEWDFSDALKSLRPKANETAGSLLLLLVSILQGQVDNTEAKNKLNDIK